MNVLPPPPPPRRVTMNISWADFKTVPFSFFLFSSHGGICGRDALSISALCTYFRWAAIYPVYFYSLTCLSPLSTVEKDQRYLDKHKNEQITIQGKKQYKNTHVRAHTQTHTHTHTHTHTYSLQYNITATLSISAERPEVNCYQAGPSTAGSGAVCLSDDRSISPGWRTDRWRLRGVMNGERNARKKNAFSPETESPI